MTVAIVTDSAADLGVGFDHDGPAAAGLDQPYTFAVTAITASFGLTPATADDPKYPSWDDVQNAKLDEAAKQAEIDSITGLVAGLQTAVDEASVEAMRKAETWRQATDALAAAAQTVTTAAEGVGSRIAPPSRTAPSKPAETKPAPASAVGR